ncbi:Spy/CpxP family protein refolding chaperone [uncultured Microscilla sp.]|uniref:Spy/CpxP family protein refolding chaperone n=1 Tax=uncultured Microscilla sp. TaxID=432653 RepID=UPI002625A559|nr:Spy/CpxP family protein refolding chaperone [uncultured Microscilla sp.]
MKSYLFLFLWVIGGSIQAFAQSTNINPNPNSAKMKRIEQMRNKFIKERLNLTPEQEGKFWPIYTKYDARKREIKQQKRRLRRRRALLTASDEQLIQKLKEFMALKQSEVDLEKAYLDKFLAVLNARQVTELYRAEEEFIRKLLRQLRRERRNKRRNGGGE